MSYHTVASWCAQKKYSEFQEVAVVMDAKKIATVPKKSTAVTAAKKSVGVTDPKNVITVKTPDGFVIHANSVSEIVSIIRSLREGE